MISPKEITARQREISRNNDPSFSVFAQCFVSFFLSHDERRDERTAVFMCVRREEERPGEKEGERKRTNNEALFASEKLVETRIILHMTM